MGRLVEATGWGISWNSASLARIGRPGQDDSPRVVVGLKTLRACVCVILLGAVFGFDVLFGSTNAELELVADGEAHELVHQRSLKWRAIPRPVSGMLDVPPAPVMEARAARLQSLIIERDTSARDQLVPSSLQIQQLQHTLDHIESDLLQELMSKTDAADLVMQDNLPETNGIALQKGSQLLAPLAGENILELGPAAIGSAGGKATVVGRGTATIASGGSKATVLGNGTATIASVGSKATVSGDGKATIASGRGKAGAASHGSHGSHGFLPAPAPASAPAPAASAPASAPAPAPAHGSHGPHGSSGKIVAKSAGIRPKELRAPLADPCATKLNVWGNDDCHRWVEEDFSRCKSADYEINCTRTCCVLGTAIDAKSGEQALSAAKAAEAAGLHNELGDLETKENGKAASKATDQAGVGAKLAAKLDAEDREVAELKANVAKEKSVLAAAGGDLVLRLEASQEDPCRPDQPNLWNDSKCEALVDEDARRCSSYTYLHNCAHKCCLAQANPCSTKRNVWTDSDCNPWVDSRPDRCDSADYQHNCARKCCELKSGHSITMGIIAALSIAVLLAAVLLALIAPFWLC